MDGRASSDGLRALTDEGAAAADDGDVAVATVVAVTTRIDFDGHAAEIVAAGLRIWDDIVVDDRSIVNDGGVVLDGSVVDNGLVVNNGGRGGYLRRRGWVGPGDDDDAVERRCLDENALCRNAGGAECESKE